MKLNIEILKNCNMCKSEDLSRYYLIGVFVKYNKEDNSIEYVATNGHILYYKKDKSLEGDYSFFENGKILDFDFKKVKSDDFNIELKDNILIGNNSYVIKVIDAEFPDYKKVIPSEYNEEETNYNLLFQSNYTKIIEKLGFFNGFYYQTKNMKGTTLIKKTKEDKNELLVINSCKYNKLDKLEYDNKIIKFNNLK